MPPTERARTLSPELIQLDSFYCYTVIGSIQLRGIRFLLWSQQQEHQQQQMMMMMKTVLFFIFIFNFSCVALIYTPREL